MTLNASLTSDIDNLSQRDSAVQGEVQSALAGGVQSWRTFQATKIQDQLSFQAMKIQDQLSFQAVKNQDQLSFQAMKIRDQLYLHNGNERTTAVTKARAPIGITASRPL
ncbi:hypothetical protein Tcan_14329 [Toxocara canis]|uniref:Uncharacterized protein n=1 Tax=Toxocara canis TaxID=6265 RepID=A0A0B2V1Q5_TOXCA|nr:hypothetical protein Tcan_14329 [Toxocara canis]